MMRFVSILPLLLLAVTLTGCPATTGAARQDVVSFDRGAFALGYADFTAATRIKCEKNPNTPECAKFNTLDAQMRKAISEPPAAVVPSSAADPFSQLLPLIMKLAPLAL